MECDGSKEVNGIGNKGGRQATAMVAKRAMVIATRVAGNEKAMAKAANSNEGGGQAKATRATATATAMATAVAMVAAVATAMAVVTATAMETAMATATMWVMMMATRLVGNEEGKGKGGKGNHDCNEVGGQGRGQGRQGDKGGQ